MRILFYVEPFLIRNNPTYFYDFVCLNFYKLMLDKNLQHDLRLFANLETLNLLKTKIPNADTRFFIYPSYKYRFLTKKYNIPWQKDGINTWIQLMKGEGEVSQDYTILLEDIWSNFPFDVIIHWGENGVITKFCDRYQITHIGMELGCCRAPFFDSVIMDVFGTNGAAIIPKLDMEQIKYIVSDNYMSKDEALFKYSNLEVSAYKKQFDLLPNCILSNLDVNKNIAYIPLQLFDDANLLYFSNYTTIKDVVADIVPKLVENNYQVIIKYHPMASKRKGSTIANSIASFFLEQYKQNVIILDESLNIDNSILFSISDLIITVNSSTGFEALYFDKILVVLGDAVYKPKNLFPKLDDVLENNFDKKKYFYNIGILRRFILGGYLTPYSILKTHKIFFQDVNVLYSLNTEYKHNAFEIALNYYKYKISSKCIYDSIFLDGLYNIEKRITTASLLLKSTKNNTENNTVEVNKNIFLKKVIFNLFEKFDQPTLPNFSKILRSIFNSEEALKTFILNENILDLDYYLRTYSDVKESNINPLEHYIRYGINENRYPRNGLLFSGKNDLLNNLLNISNEILNEQFFDDLDKNKEYYKNQLNRIYSNLQNSNNKNLVIVLHLFYKDVVDEILEYLNNIPIEFDIIVSVPNYGNKDIIKKVINKYPKSQILITHSKNSGRDIEPFIKIFPIIWSLKYKYVLKLHTKRGLFEYGDLWRKEILSSLLGNKERVIEIINQFDVNNNLNMVGTKPCYLSLKNFPYSDEGNLAKNLLKNPIGDGFFAGSMFWCRLSCLEPILSLFLRNFVGDNLANDGNILHLIERLFGQCATTINNGEIALVSPDLSEPISYECITNQESIHNYFTKKVEEFLSSKYEV